MAKPEALPKHLAKLIGDVVAFALHGAPEPKNLKKLTDWYEEDGWDNLLAGWGSEQVALKLFYLAWSSFSDAELKATLDISREIHDSDRVEFAKSLIANSFQEFDEYLCPSIHAVPVSNAQGEKAILGWLMEVHGQAGPVPLFQGVFRDENTFYDYLKNSDYILSSEQTNVSDETILRLWSRPAPPKQSVVVSVTWGYETHECPMAEATWKRIVAGRRFKRVVPYYYEGKRYKSTWLFNQSGFGTLLVTYADDAVAFEGTLHDATIVLSGSVVSWQKSPVQ